MRGLSRDDIIRMAQEVSGVAYPMNMADVKIGMSHDHLEAFAKLVAAAERERIKWTSIHSCHPECDKPVCVAMRKAVADEREACAKVCESAGPGAGPVYCAFAIRARGMPPLTKLNKAAEDNGEAL
jgi:hypothetical protein